MNFAILLEFQNSCSVKIIVEQKIASLVSLSSSVSVNTASNGVSGATCNPTQQSVPSYASTSLPRPTYTNHTSRIDVRFSRKCNVILFGLPENKNKIGK